MKYIKTVLHCAILGLGILAVSCSGSPSKGYTITGTLPADMKLDSVFISKFNYQKEEFDIIQGTKVVNGKFEFKGQTDEPVPANIVDKNHTLDISFLLENDKVNIVLKNKEGHPEITGGEIYNTVYAYEKDPEYKKLKNNYKSYAKGLFKNLDVDNINVDEEEKQKIIDGRKALESYEEKIAKIKLEGLDKVISNDSNPPLARVLAYSDTYYESRKTGGKTEDHIANLEKLNKEAGSRYISDIIEYYKKTVKSEKNAENVAVGKNFIDIAGKDLSGKGVKLSEYVGKNKFTILEFWASWCGPCRAELPNLKKAYAKYHGKGLEIVSYSIDEKHEEWVQAAKEEQQPWINAIVPNGFENKDLKLYGVNGIPASYLIDQNGKILASNDELREFDLDRTLSKFIK